MRYSSDANDPGFFAWAQAMQNGKRPRIFLDGLEVPKCTMADDDTGEVTRIVLDGDGEPFIDLSKGELFYETVQGQVSIVMEDF
jgi:hypothetical protein